MVPAWKASEFQAMARGRRILGTSMGPSATPAGARKARAIPNAKATPMRTCTVSTPMYAAAISAPAHRASAAKQSASTTRRA